MTSQAAKVVYKYSCYPRTISDWNLLPTTLLTAHNTCERMLQCEKIDPGIQGWHCQPSFPTPAFLLDNQPPEHSFNWGCEVFYLFYWSSQGNQQSEKIREDYYPYSGRSQPSKQIFQLLMSDLSD